MSINRSKNKPKDIFDDDFEVIYQEDHYSKLLRKELARRNQDYDDHGGYDNGYGRNDDDHNNYDDAYDDDYDDYGDDYDDYGDDYDDYSDNDDYNDYSEV